MKSYLSFCFFILITTYCWGQDDVVLGENASHKDSISASSADSSVVKERKHSPKLAGCLSAALPGLGQAYNKKYWKIPIDYAGFAAAGYCVYHFYSLYADYRDEYRNRLNKKPSLEPNPNVLYIRVFKLFNGQLPNLSTDLSTDNINGYKQSYQRNMQISIMVLVIWYFVNILDAVVDAHLMSFDISDNLAMYITPDFNTNPTFAKPTVGLSFTLNLK